MIQIFSNTLGKDEIEAVQNVLATRWLGKGTQCDAFEQEFADYIHAPRILLLNCATSAIYVGLRALGIQAGDEVIISTVNFVACASAILDMGATPVFADVDPHTLNIAPAEIERLKTPATKAVFLLHYGGHPCPMDDIRDVCGDTLALIEDSANAVSSRYKGQHCGTFGDAGIWSFDAMKILVMVDGGGLFLKNEEAYHCAIAYRYLGFAPKTPSGLEAMQHTQQRWWEYDLLTTAGRFISNDVLAAIGRKQLKKLPQFIARRKQIWEYYQTELAEVAPVICPPDPLPEAESSYYLYWVQTSKRDELAAYMAEHGVYTTFRYFPLHLVKYYEAHVSLPHAEHANNVTLNLPVHQNLSDSDVEKIVELVKTFFK